TNEIGNRKDISLDIKVKLAQNTKISKNLQSILKLENNEQIDLALASHCDLNKDIQGKSIKDKEYLFSLIEQKSFSQDLYEAIENTYFTEEQMLKLLTFNNFSVNYHLAGNPNITAKIMYKLLALYSNPINYHLAKNPNITEEIMLNLFALNNNLINNYLAENPNIIEEVKLKLLDSNKSRYVQA
ncbi:hypothetical protein HT667_08600, partial [Ursidibacter maritimus]|uniref:hypothetical protein n=1 Tax=Ursidibacter maritimus TaxID=1331689 RepID=UPI001C449D33